MALKAQSLFLFGLEVTLANQAIDFKIAPGGPILQATLNLGFYSLTGLMREVERALQAADPTNDYVASADRTFASGTQNRVNVNNSTGSFFQLLFASGPRTATTAAPLLGFTSTDKTGALNYTGQSSAGTVLVPDRVGYKYLPPELNKKVYGNVNVSASGVKEAVVWQIQQFFTVQFMYEPEAKAKTEWSTFFEWAIQQRLFEFTPEITTPNTIIECTLEGTSGDSKGLGFKMNEQLPNFPFNYDTGLLNFRVNIT